ncbi:unnamed protein product [Pleuronectes platessa]|uniref:Uncharacterized protein n=1 Tax=Pleuronectes platessa TaxID=8262 RepID=A0A9N7U3Y6_PLEPL|nr:unnamed protein product [Pleuronectes platessa]
MAPSCSLRWNIHKERERGGCEEHRTAAGGRALASRLSSPERPGRPKTFSRLWSPICNGKPSDNGRVPSITWGLHTLTLIHRLQVHGGGAGGAGVGERPLRSSLSVSCCMCEPSASSLLLFVEHSRYIDACDEGKCHQEKKKEEEEEGGGNPIVPVGASLVPRRGFSGLRAPSRCPPSEQRRMLTKKKKKERKKKKEAEAQEKRRGLGAFTPATRSWLHPPCILPPRLPPSD